jgi:1-acyl-sn-glycerol-3-phosphate acyltransferase
MTGPLAVARGLLRILLALLMAVLGVPAAILVLLVSRGSPQLVARHGKHAVHVWSRLVVRLLGIRIRVVGTPPRSGSFVVSNHVSHFDILAVTATFPTSLLAKKEILWWPLIGQVAWMIGTVFVDRQDRSKTEGVGHRMRHYLEGGATVTLFAEGTCGDGQAVLPFKRSLFAVPEALEMPTHPMALRYPNPAAAWADGPMPVHMFRLLCRPSLEVVLAFGDPILPGLPRRELAFATQAKVEELFDSIRP